MTSQRPSTLLRVLIERHPWTWHEFVKVYDSAARELGEDTALSLRQLGRWMSGELTGLPQPAARRVLRRIFGQPVEQLFAAADIGDLHNDRAGPDERELVMSAARGSCDHAMEVGAFEMTTDTLDGLRDDVARLARGYHRTAPTVLLSEALRVRDQAYRLLERARRPAHEADLYLVAGQACALMAAASFDLGYPGAAEDQARAGYAYGELVDYPPLRAWCRGLQAEAAYWTGRPRRALSLIEAGLADAPTGTAGVRLRSIQARAWSYLGDGAAERAAASVQSAARARDTDSTPDELHDEIGGHFSFDPARQARCEAATYVRLGHGHQAEQAATAALELYAGTDGAWRLIELEVAADLAAARLLSDDIDGAEDALAPLWQLSPHERREGLTHRARQAGTLLARPAFRHLPAAEQLAERIEDYAAATVTRALPSAGDH